MARRKRKPDNLDLDVRRAELMGYGIHYGRFKVDYPHTRREDEDEAEQIPKGWTEKICPTCQRKFYGKSNRIFCSVDCRIEMNNKKIMERRRNRETI